MNTEDYVSYPVALALKKAGFNEECRDFYTPKGDLGSATEADNFNSLAAQYQGEWFSNVISAPTLAVAQKWLREKGIDICVWRSFSVSHGYHYQIVSNYDWENAEIQAVCNGRSYEQSLSDAINVALELIEKKGE